MGILLALGSSVLYGLADYLGGILSRRGSFVAIALVGQVTGLVFSLVAVLLLPEVAAGPEDLAWGALSGVGTGLGMLFLYRGLSRGHMSVVVPISAVGGVALPILVGVALLGERPSVLSWLGIAAAVPAIWLVSRVRGPSGSGSAAATTDALVASMAIALQYTALAQAGPDAGLWPIVTGRVAATLVLVPVALRARQRRISVRLTLGAAAVGVMATLALLLYLLATQVQLMTVAVVLSCLYPVIPVLLGITVLHERVATHQVVGLLAAGAAVVLITVG
ncbi:DMT family transporter [Occultella glacieicola]|uniref:DMT family transporter n=1 Tax=Occultella glacieicola TaxID=2518684 RepID=A0ABY2E5W4_9MICO|nr:EamA family transporter [Occultella glacieicola]TDE95978.1 DMT family transporter [Occultella glacieicola]